MPSLRSWLKQAPQPASLRIRDDQDETRAIELHPNLRNRWRFAEDAIMAARARVVEALSEKGAILRTFELEDESGEGDAADTKDTLSKLSSKIRSDTYRELGGVLDRYGERMVQAFREGASSQRDIIDQQKDLVGDLIVNLTAAITNFHNVTVALGEQIKENAEQSGEGNGSSNKELLAKVLGAAMVQGMGGGGGGDANGKTNGTHKPGKERKS